MLPITALPPFVQEYRTEGAVLYFNSGNPARAGIIYNFLKTVMPETSLASPEVEPFLILEGYLYQHEVDADTFPTIAYYLNNRNHLSPSELWELWGKTADIGELSLIINGFAATRRHALETLADTPLAEKKSGLKPKQ